MQDFPGGLVVKDSVLSLWWLRFNHWPRNLPDATGAALKNKNKKGKCIQLSFSIQNLQMLKSSI